MSLRGHIRQVLFSPPSNIEAASELWSLERCRNAIRGAKAVTEQNRSQGYKQGYQQGKQEGRRLFEKASRKSNSILANAKVHIEKGINDSLRELLKREVCVDPVCLEKLVQPVLDKIAGELFVISAHPSRVASLETLLMQNGIKATVRPDSALEPEKTVFTLPYGEIVTDEAEFIEQILGTIKVGEIRWPR